jgi:hypothetical protein
VSGTAGRYQRSMAGMIGALLVTLAVIVGFVVFRAINRDDLEIHRDTVDYLETVQGLQQGGLVNPAYPAELPDGWRAVDATFDPESLTWELDVLTDEGKFLGVRQGEVSARALVEEYVDEAAHQDGEVELSSKLATDWSAFSDDGGDSAVVTELRDGTHLLVVGTGGQDEVRDFAASLVRRRL